MLAAGTAECFITNSEVLGSCACETNGREYECRASMSRAWMNRGKLLIISACAKHGRGDIAGDENGFRLPAQFPRV